MLFLGATGAFAHFCIIRSFSAADASLVTPFEFVRLPVSAAFGFVLFGETAEIWTWIGALVIFGATYYITWYETKVLKRNKAA